MIVFENGHWRSTRTFEEDASIIEMDLSNLTEEERAVVQMMMAELQDPQSDASLMHALGGLDWVRTPVDIETFCMDPYFLGNTCDTIYNVWLEDLKELFAGTYREAIFTGAIGTGKCVTPETLVWDVTLECAVPVGKASKELKVASVESGRVVYKRAEISFSGEKYCVRVELRDGEAVVLSGDHPVKTRRGWVVAEELYSSDCVAIVSSYVKNSPISWSPVQSVTPVGFWPVYDLSVPGTHCFVANGIVVHNTFAASVGLCRLLYLFSCMRDPHRSFGIAPNSNISLICLSVNEALATKVAYENIATKIEASPYFQEHFPFEKTKKELRFPKKIWVAARATNDGSVLGLNVVSGLLDETNFMPKGSQKTDPRFQLQDRAEVLYNAMQRRMKSRFERKGRLPGILFVVSSKQTNDDFTAKRIHASQNDPTVFVRDYALWQTKPEIYSTGGWFHVVVGDEQTPSRIIGEDEDIEIIKETLPENCVVIEVPEDFRGDFTSDLEGAVRDLAGVATVTVSPYIQRREKIQNAIDAHLVHPYSTEVYDPSQPGRFFWNKIVIPDFDSEGGLRPIIDPYAPRHIHIDPSLSGDATGFAMGHVSKWVQVVRRDDENNKYPERAPFIVIDFVLKIIPPVGGEIILGDVRRIVYQLARHGFTITCVSIDSWQSVDAIQKLNQRGFNAIQLSVDRTMGPYDLLKNALYEDRIKFYDYPVLLEELRKVEHDRARRKVDHPPTGSKDCADAVAGVVATLTERSSTQPLQMMRSSSLHTDAWMLEHQQAILAQAHGGSGDIQELGELDMAMLPPILIGSDGNN